MRLQICFVLVLGAMPALASSRTITVGPSGRQFVQLRDALSSQNLEPGDVVLVDGGATYSSIVVGDDDDGTAADPVVLRWSGVGSRPVIAGGTHTVKFERSSHVVLQGFEVTGGSSTCIFNEAHGSIVRDVIVRDCPAHGILGADRNSGSFTLEYSEVARAGSGQLKHPIYMQSDEVAHPGAVFTMRFNHVHSGNGGNLLKSRHERNVVHYNWFEGAAYQEIELIGPDCLTQAPAWTAGKAREDSDIVGNVFVHTSSWGNVARVGGDLNGRSLGRVRFVNNTFVVDRPGAASAVRVQLGLESLEMHNNAIVQPGAGAPAIVVETPSGSVDTPECGSSREPWATGRRVWGSYNWVESDATAVPAEWGATRKGADPGWASAAERRLRPLPGSPLIDMGTHAPSASPGFEVPGALVRPLFDPPPRMKLAPGGAQPRLLYASNLDIGAFEEVDAATHPIAVNGASPLVPPDQAAAATQGAGRAQVTQRATPRPAPARPQPRPVERAPVAPRRRP